MNSEHPYAEGAKVAQKSQKGGQEKDQDFSRFSFCAFCVRVSVFGT
jgi:hypothetical protein